MRIKWKRASASAKARWSCWNWLSLYQCNSSVAQCYYEQWHSHAGCSQTRPVHTKLWTHTHTQNSDEENEKNVRIIEMKKKRIRKKFCNKFHWVKWSLFRTCFAFKYEFFKTMLLSIVHIFVVCNALLHVVYFHSRLHVCIHWLAYMLYSHFNSFFMRSLSLIVLIFYLVVVFFILSLFCLVLYVFNVHCTLDL